MIILDICVLSETVSLGQNQSRYAVNQKPQIRSHQSSAEDSSVTELGQVSLDKGC